MFTEWKKGGLREECGDMDGSTGLHFLKTWGLLGNTVCQAQAYMPVIMWQWFGPLWTSYPFFILWPQVIFLNFGCFANSLLFTKLRECSVVWWVKRLSSLREDTRSRAHTGGGPLESSNTYVNSSQIKSRRGRFELLAPLGVCSPSRLHWLMERGDLGERESVMGICVCDGILSVDMSWGVTFRSLPLDLGSGTFP